MADHDYEQITQIHSIANKFNPDTIPTALTVLPNWVCWSLVSTSKQSPNDKPTKRPVRIYNDELKLSKWGDADHQYSFQHCLKLYNRYPNLIGGLGFIPNPDNGIVVIDYDNCFPLEQDDPRNKYLQIASETTFVEISQSQSGAHIFLFGNLVDRKNDSANSGVELYPGRKQAFIAMTGNTYNYAPSIIDSNQAMIDSHLEEFFNTHSNNSHSYSSYDDYSAYEIPSHIPNGNRNVEMTRLCGYLFAILNNPIDVAAKMFAYNITLCETPLSKKELETIIDSIGRKHHANNNGKYQHLIDNIFHIKSTNSWFDFSDMTEMSANSLDITHLKEFPGRKGRPTITKWLAQQPDFNQAADFTWYPMPYGHTIRTIVSEGRTLINSWKGFATKPINGDVQPWLTHLEHVVPEDDYRRALLWWMAYNMQHPDKKINWQPIILGVSGAGKDALFRPIATILGSAFKSIGNKDIKGDYDDGLYQTKILHISEAQGLSGSAIEFYKRITSTESSDMQILNIKCKGKVLQHNLCNVLVITNNIDAMRFTKDDRRPLVMRSTEVMTEDMQTAYFDNWLEHNGPEHLFHYLLNYDLSEYKPGVRPYRTVHFDALFETTRSDIDLDIEELLSDYEVALPDLVRKAIDMDDKYSTTKIIVWLESNGWVRWDRHIESRRIKRKVNGAQCAPKSRFWYVKKDSKFYDCGPTEMCVEVERVEELFIKRYKF